MEEENIPIDNSPRVQGFLRNPHTVEIRRIIDRISKMNDIRDEVRQKVIDTILSLNLEEAERKVDTILTLNSKEAEEKRNEDFSEIPAEVLDQPILPLVTMTRTRNVFLKENTKTVRDVLGHSRGWPKVGGVGRLVLEDIAQLLANAGVPQGIIDRRIFKKNPNT